MAHEAEPMEIDSIDTEFDNKENTFHHSNVQPCTEKGYEELDVSELNMKLRYSVTPAGSPMSKSFTANCVDNKSKEDDLLNITVTNNNLTRSLNSSMSNNESVVKSLKTLPLQPLSTDQCQENKIPSVLRSLDSKFDNDVTVMVSELNDDDHSSYPSTSSSIVHTPEATTPTKDMSKSEGSPIMRGLKSMLNIFRSSQSPIPPTEGVKADILSPIEIGSPINEDKHVLASTPIAAHKNKDTNTSKQCSPYKDSIVFNEDLEKELQWKDETTILFSQEKIPVHKLFFQYTNIDSEEGTKDKKIIEPEVLNTAEFMDISYNESLTDKTLTDIQTEMKSEAVESDGEFVDCETTFAKDKSHTHTPVDATVTDSNIEQVADIPTTDIRTLNEGQSLNEYHTSNVVAQDNAALPDTNVILSLDSQVDNDFNRTENIVYNKEVSLKESVFVLAQAVDQKKEDIKFDQQKILDKTSTKEEINDQNAELKQNNLYENEECRSTTNSEAIADENVVTSDKENNTHTDIEIQFTEIVDVDINKVIVNKQKEYTSDLKNEKIIEKSLALSEEIDIKDNIHFRSSTQFTEMIDIDVSRKEVLEHSKIADSADTIDNTETFETNKIKPNSYSIIKSTAKLSEVVNVDSKENIMVQFEKIEDPEVIEKVGEMSDTEAEFNLNNTNRPEKLNYELEVDFRAVDSTAEEIIEHRESSLHEIESHKYIKQGFFEVSIDKQISDSNEKELIIQSNKIISNCDLPFDVPLPDEDDIDADSSASCDKKTEVLNLTNNLSNNELKHESDVVVCDVITQIGSIVHDVYKGNNDSDEIYKNSNNSQSLPDIVNETIISDQLQTIEAKTNELSNTTIEVMYNIDELISQIAEESKECSHELVDNLKKQELMNIDNIYSVEQTIENHIVAGDQNIDFNEKKNLVSKIDKMNDEEILASENNSPFVSIAGGVEATSELKLEDDLNNIEESKHVAPASPPIVSKGYSFNFDEMDEPFATKTNILSSPDSAMSSLEAYKKGPKIMLERRKSVSDRKNSDLYKSKQNNVAMGDLNRHGKKPNLTDKQDIGSKIRAEGKLGDKSVSSIDNQYIDSTSSTNIINSSSSEQSMYFSAGTSSNESTHPRNVFNIPEIDDKNFNPFATKSKMQSSLSSSFEMENPFATKSKILNSADTSMIDIETTATGNLDATMVIDNSKHNNQQTVILLEDKIATEPMEKYNTANISNTSSSKATDNKNVETEPMEKDITANISNTSSSSKATDDKDVTVREINTEDEDTQEGPFLEAATDDSFHTEKLTDLNRNLDMMQLKELSLKDYDENPDAGEMFIDAQAFEFLLNQNKTNVVADSGKESLFLKFDPLFAKRISSDGVLAALSNIQRQSTPTKLNKNAPSDTTFDMSTAGPSTLNITYEGDNMTEESFNDHNVTVSKPMMVVTPAMNPAVTPRNKTISPTRSDRHSITFTSPAMAVIDRLLSMSANNSLVDHDTTVTQVNRGHNEADLALTQLRELLAEKEISVYNLRTESKHLKERLSTLESQMRTLESESGDRLKKINDLNERLSEKAKINKSMAAVVEGYERTIASLIAETELDKKRHAEEKMQLIKERDEQSSHLVSMESAFSDLHSKYEKSKQVILSYKANEDVYKKSLKEFEDNVTKMQNNYELLKQHATSKLNHANQELEKMNRAHEAEVVKLNAMIKRKDLHITSLEESLIQKTKANEELTAICDELINKVG